MALFPYPLEHAQLNVELRLDADPHESARRTERRLAALPATPAVQHMTRVHALIQSRATGAYYDDRRLLDEIWLAVDRHIA